MDLADNALNYTSIIYRKDAINMAESRTQLWDFIEKETQKYKGVALPLKASKVEQTLVTKVPCNMLHPNLDDEFCIKEIGPNYGIINKYENQLRLRLEQEMPLFDEPIIVEKMYPHGYMILNGHHRWAAARSLGIKNIPVKVTSLTHEGDIRKMLNESNCEKRVTFDLDEVVFSNKDNLFEDKPHTIFKHYNEQVRLGIPALFHFFHEHSYDVWVFSSEYYSMDYIKELFKKYASNINGIVTGTKRKSSFDNNKNFEQMISQKYNETINVDNESIIRITKGLKDFDQFLISDNGRGWSGEVMNIVKGIY